MARHGLEKQQEEAIILLILYIVSKKNLKCVFETKGRKVDLRGMWNRSRLRLRFQTKKRCVFSKYRVDR